MGLNEDGFYDLLHAIDVTTADAEAVRGCKALVLDHLACGLFGAGLPWTQQVRAVASAELPASPESSSYATGARLYGSSTRLPATSAALVNGTAGHGFDLDDLHYPTMTHPGAVIGAAAFAIADEEHVDGRRLLTAVLAGYEAMARVSRAVGLQAGRLGFHGTSIQGPIGAAVAVVKLLGGGRQQLVDAVGIAASFGSGIKAFQHGPGAVKRLHAGRAAQGGVLAGRLAMRGFPGPRSAMTGPFGFARVYGLGAYTDRPVNLGTTDDPPAVREIYIKPYAACGALHGLIRASEDLAPVLADLRRIQHVVLGCPRRVLEQNDIPDPTDVLTAQYSAQYAVAVGLLGRARDPSAFALDGDPDPTAADLISRMALEVDDEADASYPDANEGRVTVRTDDGDTVSRYGSMSEADSQGWDVAVEKLRHVTDGLLATADAVELVRVVDGLAVDQDPSACLDVLARAQSGADATTAPAAESRP